MEHYVTLFDSLFLPQGLALHASMQRNAGNYALWILCVDESTFEVLSKLALKNVRLIPVAQVETAALATVKPSRTRGEYCWTLTPFSPKFVFDADASVQRVTYLDADMWFSGNPAALLREFEQSGKSVMITEHAYAPENDQSRSAGRYCVQFVTFVRDRGEPVRTWWADRCIEWCYSRLEDGKFGDQMYLDDWAERFAGHVHVLQQRQLLQAPWNITRFAPADAVAFHFHELRLMIGGRVLLTESYRIHRKAMEILYKPYLRDLAAAVATLRQSGFEARPQIRVGQVHLWLRMSAARAYRWWKSVSATNVVRL